MKFSTLTGMHDVGPPEIQGWQRVEGVARRLFEGAGFFELRTPLLEAEALFTRGLGQTTDIVEKEMYVFEDSGEKRVALRPEGTASLVRAYLEHFAGAGSRDSRFYYLGPMFRRERPQKGRYRQFHQIGAEVFGSAHPYTDAELISLVHSLFKSLSISPVSLHLNTLGCKACRPPYRELLITFLRPLASQLCEECGKRLQRNPLRVLDCKKESCQALLSEVPTSLDFLCEGCRTHFEEVQQGLRQFQVPYEIKPRLVRGLDYYERTAFEFVSDRLGAQNALAGGGRYDGLVEILGGSSTPAIGFALGLERVVSLLDCVPTQIPPKIFFAPLGEKALRELLPFIPLLREAGYTVYADYEPRSLKALLREANHREVDYVVIVGESELQKGLGQVKPMKGQGEACEVPLASLPLYFQTKRGV